MSRLPEPEVKSKQMLFAIPKTQQEMLDAAKGLGVSKQDMVVQGITLIHYFNNKAGWKSTNEAVFPLRLLENLKEDFRQRGASAEFLAEIDVQIAHYRAELKRLEREGDRKQGAK